jgi:hypothetical protein
MLFMTAKMKTYNKYKHKSQQVSNLKKTLPHLSADPRVFLSYKKMYANCMSEIREASTYVKGQAHFSWPYALVKPTPGFQTLSKWLPSTQIRRVK